MKSLMWSARRIYVSSRAADQLETRYEVFGKRLTETFSDRDDHMVYRSIVYDRRELCVPSRKHEQRRRLMLLRRQPPALPSAVRKSEI